MLKNTKIIQTALYILIPTLNTKLIKIKQRVNMWNGTNNVIKKNIKTVLHMDTTKIILKLIIRF